MSDINAGYGLILPFISNVGYLANLQFDAKSTLLGYFESKAFQVGLLHQV